MRKADKLFQITNLIRARGPITAQRIADEMAMSVRSIYRYIDDLSASGIPVYGTRGEGYRLTENYELPPLSLSEEELEALMLGMAIVKNWTGDTLGSAARSLLHKIESTQPHTAQQVATNLPVGVPGYELDPTALSRWEDLYQATKYRYPANLQYVDADANPSARKIYPLGLFYWGGTWTVGAWCCLREDYRAFRIDRINGLAIQSHNPFPFDRRFTKDAYIAAVRCG